MSRGGESAVTSDPLDVIVLCASVAELSAAGLTPSQIDLVHDRPASIWPSDLADQLRAHFELKRPLDC